MRHVLCSKQEIFTHHGFSLIMPDRVMDQSIGLNYIVILLEKNKKHI